jgi:superfamily I DNA/RNA helicase/RecB family exonuclease
VPQATLDAVQQRVIDADSHTSISLLGAPGSGKTHTLIELVAHRIAQGLRPEQIIVLTPHRLAANRLRDSLALRIERATNGPLARTPSSLAFAIAQESARKNGTELPRMLTGSEQDAILADLIAGDIAEGTGPVWPDPLVPEVRTRRAFRSELRDLFSRSTERGMTPDDLSQLGTQRNFPQWIAAASVWRDYRAVLASFRHTSFDSSEFLALATTALGHPDVLSDVSLVVVDDAQELTFGAMRLLRAMASRGMTIVASGDPDVTSTAFRGALPNFLGRMAVELDLPHVETIVLESVYRHGPQIRQLVQNFSHGGTQEAGLQRKAVSVVENAQEHSVITRQGSSRHQELSAISRVLRREHIEHGVPWSSMVVVVRNGSIVPHVARALAVLEVPTRTLLSERSLTEQPVAMDLIAVLAVAMGRLPLSYQTTVELLTSPLVSLSTLELRRLRMALRQEELAQGGSATGEELLVSALQDSRLLLTLDFAPARRVTRFSQLLSDLTQASLKGDTIQELLWRVWEYSGLATVWSEQALGSGLLADEAHRNLDGVMALFTSAQRYVERYPDRPAAEFIAEMLQSDVPEDTLAPQAYSDAVLVCTPTAVIGDQRDVVVVAAVQENIWPNLKPRGSLLFAQELATEQRGGQLDPQAQRKSVLEDEQRMFALAVSRAQKSVIVTSSVSDEDVPSAFFFATKTLTEDDDSIEHVNYPLTLRGITGYLRHALTTELSHNTGSDTISDLASALAKLSAAGVPGANPEQWYGLTPPSTSQPLADLEDPEAVVSVSPSKLDTFEKNQLAWFIESVVGRTSGTAQGIGSIIHTVMEHASEHSEPLSSDELWQQVDSRWQELSFEAPWLSEATRKKARKMVDSLAQYLDDFHADGKTLLASEGGFSLDVGRARVRGYIDRIEQDSIGRVVIVDLKTGKNVPGKKDIPEHAQLACYQLALTEGALEAVPDGLEPGGAKLIYISDGVSGKLYREVIQDTYDEKAIGDIAERIERAATLMAGTSFQVPLLVSEERGDPYSRYEFRIHTVPAVSAS